MPRITMEEQPDFPTLPTDSIVFLKVHDLEVKEVDGQRGKWQKLEFTFKILGIQQTGDGSPLSDYEPLIGEKIWGSVPFRLTDSPENRLRLWTEAILGMELGVGFELDTDVFRDREVRGVTTTYEKRTRDPRTGLPFKNHQVSDLLIKGVAAPVAPAGDPWSTPAQAPQAQAPQQQQFANPTGQQPVSAGANNPWSDEPPF